ncbi:hypothetical protein PV08_03476 [Exophiala spinifera]|uniref:Xylanolytic transcriptional activator regulatory domain-containing protein n=1 Tax=Exophiala spinifera TaxID=91928 RepID=A0A0D2A2K8_9EURO|nr:uncharacterized protein PV08_03476 [Exophiala spinifera]KIW19182.1 hypothetical protein PV08_03476 [Exophiala spinifera]
MTLLRNAMLNSSDVKTLRSVVYHMTLSKEKRPREGKFPEELAVVTSDLMPGRNVRQQEPLSVTDSAHQLAMIPKMTPDLSFGQNLLTTLEQDPSSDRWPRFRALGVLECQAYLQHYDELIAAVPFAIRRPKLSLAAFMTRSPLLLLSIILTASSSCQILESESESLFRHILADRVVVRGQRSLELLQGLLTYLIYHHHRHNHDTQQYFQFLQLALAMAADLGLYKRFSHPKPSVWASESDLNVLRAFLLCYYLSCGVGILGYDRPDGMRCIQSLRHAAQSLAQRSTDGFDREAPALVELLYILAQHRDYLNCPTSNLPQSWNLAAAMEVWSASYPTASTLTAIKSMQHFVYVYGMLKCARQDTLSKQDRETSLETLALVLSHVLERGAIYLVLFGVAEWGHILTTLFLLPRVEGSAADHPAGTNGVPLTLHYVSRFRQNLQEARTLATRDIVLGTPTFFGWLDRILCAVERQAALHPTSIRTRQDQDRGDESAYELVNAFIDQEPNQGAVLPRGEDKDQEDFWSDFMSEWLDW